MRKVVIQYLFYGSILFGVWTTLLFMCFHHDHGYSQQREIQKPESVWSLENNIHQQGIHDLEEIPRPFLRDEEPDKDESEGQKPSVILRDNVNYSDPELARGYSQYGFNIIVSGHLGKERVVPDTRNTMCLNKRYPKYLPTTSIIICFHNEEFNALFRTVSSVINLTPDYILKEIILVDDKSEFDDLKEKLDDHLADFLEKIKLIRNKEREGLIRARLIGASYASGDVLMFLDSHSEVNRVWLEPLLFAISKDPKVVVCPVIDVINDMTLEYTPAPVVRGAFDWKLQFKWDNVLSYEMEGPEGATGPIRSPAIAGGIFAIQRQYFYEIGQYDKGMNLWGGENLELSLRVWMCGGQVFVIPCSRVGHINKLLNQDYFNYLKSLTYNNLRLVHVWLDDYKEQFFFHQPGLRSMKYGNITERVELRKRLGCKSFQWYLDTVFPELEASIHII